MNMNYLEDYDHTVELKRLYRYGLQFAVAAALLYAINSLTFINGWWFVFPVFAAAVWIITKVYQHFVSLTGHDTEEWEQRELRRLQQRNRRTRFTIDHLELRSFDQRDRA